MPNSRRRRQRGFTLVEVLLVLVILVILASLVVTAYGPIQRRARINAARTQVGLFKTAMENFQLVTGNYPTTDQGLEALRNPPSDLPDADPADWPMIDSEIPLDPWGMAYQYESPGQHNVNGYDIWSLGPDKVDGTEDDIGNWEE